MQEKHYWSSGFFMLRNVKVMSWRRGKLLKEYAEHGSSEKLTFANFKEIL